MNLVPSTPPPPLVLVSREDLVELIRAGVRAELDRRDASADRSDDEWITVDAAAALLGLHPRTVTRLATSDTTFPARRIGRLWRFDRAALARWIDAQNSRRPARLKRGAR